MIVFANNGVLRTVVALLFIVVMAWCVYSILRYEMDASYRDDTETNNREQDETDQRL